MENNNFDFEQYKKAKKQVEEIKGFYIHFASYVAVMLFIIFINLKFTPNYYWFIWTLGGWGIGLFFHGAHVFNWIPFLSKDWEERKIREFMENEKKNKDIYE